tara:strand:- start:4099 stop:4278 length:180 start_codon:yes stop_codon:yes gene_type:complete
MNGTRIEIKIVAGAHHHQRVILDHLGMTTKMSGTKMTGTLKADLRMTLNLGSPERLDIN